MYCKDAIPSRPLKTTIYIYRLYLDRCATCVTLCVDLPGALL
ncbi:hypothetical protein HMPREF7215_2666 [Pyramidobacter piscolens W5455]|uniref:Uncharacterized protein n=1 Tax=Pyramidobacter piscolens W5455 TaxID=352165 RepID=A0ABM9ZVK8_9BACT|nr:hypothetical protein HMPREF7215_2666 [Pyramidobacter piscolens W5455]